MSTDARSPIGRQCVHIPAQQGWSTPPSRSNDSHKLRRLFGLTPQSGEVRPGSRTSLRPSKCLSRTRRTLPFSVTAAGFPFEGGCTGTAPGPFAPADTAELRGRKFPRDLGLAGALRSGRGAYFVVSTESAPHCFRDPDLGRCCRATPMTPGISGCSTGLVPGGATTSLTVSPRPVRSSRSS